MNALTKVDDRTRKKHFIKYLAANYLGGVGEGGGVSLLVFGGNISDPS